MVYNPTDIYTEDDLSSVTSSEGIINCDIVVRGEYIRALTGVKKIKGFLGLSEASLESLGNLKEIEGNFWFSAHSVYSKLFRLGNLESIGGDMILRYSNIVDLGELKKVMGRVSLRDTQITDLGKLKYIGASLHIPKRLENIINLNEVEIMGPIKYWNDSKTKKRVKSKEEIGLIDSIKKPVYWQHLYIYSYSDINKATSSQKIFYDHYKAFFLNGEYIDLEGNDNYAFILLFDLLREYKKDKYKLNNYLKELLEHYPKTRGYDASMGDEVSADFDLSELIQKVNDIIRERSS